MISRKFAIHTNTLSSIYMDSSIKSKITSQLLFGELLIVKSQRDDFYYIENYQDGHCGWIYKESFSFLSSIEFERLKDRAMVRIFSPLTKVLDEESGTSLFLPAGSCLHDYELKKGCFRINKKEFHIASEDISYHADGELKELEKYLDPFLNAPFLEGGKSILGIDMSGLVQLIYSLCGFSLPRNAQQQSKIGVSVYSLDQVRTGDLIFVYHDDMVKQIYIYLDRNKVISLKEQVVVLNLSELEKCTSPLLIRRLV